MSFPIAISYLFILCLILFACSTNLTKVSFFSLWSFIIIYIHYFWFIAYTIAERRILATRDYLLDYGRYLPIWGFTILPYGKGSIYLRKVESFTPVDFAITQLKAVKLAFWAFLLNYGWMLMNYGQSYFHIPTLDMALSDYASGQHYTIAQAWTCLLNRFFAMLLSLTITGHLAVATCRMCGFRILRNTYKPLQSETVAEFWNRYNFYFKELMAEFYFYPAYFRYFKRMPRFRFFFATLSAATFGNILFHFLAATPNIMIYGLATGLYGFIPFILYACVLGVSIGISQLRSRTQKKQSDGVLKKSISIILVLAFYAILGLFNQSYQSVSILINFKILGSLFNLTW